MASLSGEGTPRIRACRSTLSPAEFPFMFEIQLFGRLQVRTRGIRLSGADSGGARPRHLLALLALRGEMSTSELSELLHAPKKTIEADLSVLRHHLEPNTGARDSVIIGH